LEQVLAGSFGVIGQLDDHDIDEDIADFVENQPRNFQQFPSSLLRSNIPDYIREHEHEEDNMNRSDLESSPAVQYDMDGQA
ncbi:unnamed protein product, partial [Amoebophrya sp. A25]